MSEHLSTVTIDPGKTPTAVVIWLHGLGADGHDFAPLVPHLNLPAQHGIRFVFPHAPMRPVTLNGGAVMRAWYDIYQLASGPQTPEDQVGIQAAQQQLDQLIVQEQSQFNLTSQQIILAGFSQGGALALYTGLRYPEQLGGILGLSTYMPLAESLAEERAGANQTTPIVLMHGTQDPIVPYQQGTKTFELLQALDYSVEWYSYAMEHQVIMEQIQTIGEVLRGWTRV